MGFLKCLTPLHSLQRFFQSTPCNRLFPKKMIDPWDLVTGKERWQAIQYAKGNLDPFYAGPYKQGPGTIDCPNVVPSFMDKRLVYCYCIPHGPIIRFWLHEGFPRRCRCNKWFILERLPPPKLYEDSPDAS